MVKTFSFHLSLERSEFLNLETANFTASAVDIKWSSRITMQTRLRYSLEKRWQQTVVTSGHHGGHLKMWPGHVIRNFRGCQRPQRVGDVARRRPDVKHCAWKIGRHHCFQIQNHGCYRYFRFCESESRTEQHVDDDAEIDDIHHCRQDSEDPLHVRPWAEKKSAFRPED
jgi:hypothetical protein